MILTVIFIHRLIKETGTSGAIEGQNNPRTSCVGLEEPSETDALLAASDPTKQGWYHEVQRLRRAHSLGSSQAMAAAAQSAGATAQLQTLERIKKAKLAGKASVTCVVPSTAQLAVTILLC